MRLKTIDMAFVLVIAVNAIAAFSVAQTAQKPAFEVASIKPVAWQQGRFHGGGCHGIDSHERTEVSTNPTPLGRCVFLNTPLVNIIQFAYSEPTKPQLRISGGDNWIQSQAYEVQASAQDPQNTTEEQLRLMLQELLLDRFKLRLLRDVHEEQGFALLNADNGRVLKREASNEERAGPMFIHLDGTEMIARGEQITMQTLINFLSGQLQRPIEDESGLRGIYSIALHFTPNEDADGANPERIPNEPHRPSLFNALQDQLGLRLEPRKVPVETLMIDSVQRPPEN